MAYDFDGTNDSIALQNLAFGNGKIFETVTISAWIKTDFQGSNLFGNWAILDFDRSEYFSFYVRGDNGKLGFSTRFFMLMVVKTDE